MRLVRFSGIPGRRARAAVLGDIFPKYVFIPLFIIFATACLLLAGCTNEYVVAPDDDNGGGTDDPVCNDSQPSVDIISPPFDAPTRYPVRVPVVWRTYRDNAASAVRYLLLEVIPGATGEPDIAMLNEHPELFEDLWSDWEPAPTEYDGMLIGEDEPLLRDHYYLFAIQLMDSCGRKTSVFSHERNARQFMANSRYPALSVMNPMLGSGSFAGTNISAESVLVTPGVPLTFLWEAANAFDWMMPVHYRYGWDVQNLDDDDDWLSDWSPWMKQSLSVNFNSGVHVLYIEARDEARMVTRARIEIEITPLQMDRDLLWVDDYPLGAYIPSMTDPSESEHDEFWTAICSRAPGFDPGMDIFPADELHDTYGDDPLPLEVLSRYKHVIWTYSSSVRSIWENTIYIEPIFFGNTYSPPIPVTRSMFKPNTLALYLAGGGSVLTCGRADRPGGGLSEIFPDEQTLPASVLDELIPQDRDVEYAELSLVHDDYYVTVIDKVSGQFKTGIPGISRSLDRDAMRMAIESGGMQNPDLPDTLTLDETVTCFTCFFNPQDRGFTYVEVYDPQYYMDYLGRESHDCFSPLYRMSSRSTMSPLDYGAIALVASNPICEDPGRTGYESYHFGLPLWFIDHEQVEQIADYIFDQWDIR